MKWQLDHENQMIKCHYGGDYFSVFRDGRGHSQSKTRGPACRAECVNYFPLLSRRYASATTSDCTRHSVAD